MEVAPISRAAGRPSSPRGALVPLAVLGAIVVLLGVTAIASRAPLTASPVRAGVGAGRGGGPYLGAPPLAATLFSVGAAVALAGIYMRDLAGRRRVAARGRPAAGRRGGR